MVVEKDDALSLPKGYKQTEVGVIPEDWDCLSLILCVDYIHGKAHERYIDELGKFVVVNSKFISSEGSVRKYSNSSFCTAKVGDVLTVLSDLPNGKALAKCFLVDKNNTYAVNQRVCIWRSKSNADSRFLYYVLNRNKYFLALNDGVSQTHILNHHIEKCKIQLPSSTSEQTAIANALSDMDALIAQTSTLIEKKKAIKQGVMQELLKPKEGWVTKKLGEIGEISGSGVDKKIVEGELPVRLVNYLDVYKRDFIYSNELSHWVTAPHLKSSFCKVKAGDVFFTPSSETREDIALAAVAMEDIDDAVYSYHVVRARINEDWDLRFKAYVFSTKHFLQQAETLCEGSGKRYVLTLPKFRSLEVSYPSSKSEQKSISDTLWDIDSEIWNYQSKLQKLKLQKQGMMQALLTGKIRFI
jgi:type I restriction enzyme S subunit